MTNLVQFPGLGLSFELDRVAFSIGGMNIYWYGVCIAVGMCLALVFAFRHSVEFGVDADAMVDVILIGVVMGILWVFSKLMWRWKVEYADLLFERQQGRGSLVICNHTSMAELLAVETALFFGGRRVRPIFKSEFAKSKIVRWAFSRVGGIPVERGTADMKCLRAAQHALQRGEDVLIFPEGTRIRSREIKPEVHGGFARIAQMGKAPVNPLAICGWSDITPKGKKLMRPKKCWIRAGKAISLSDAPAELKRKERLAWFESEAMNRVYTMRDDLCAEHPGRF